MKTMRRILLAILILVLPAVMAAAEELNSWDEVEQALAQACENHQSQTSLQFGSALLDEMIADNQLMHAVAARAGIQTIRWSWWSDGRVEVTSMEPYDCPYRAVQDRDELLAAVASMREAGAEAFVLLPEAGLYTEFRSDTALKKGLLLEGGLAHWEHEYSSDGKKSLKYTGCEYWNGVVRRADSEAGALMAIREVASLGSDSFALLLDAATYDSLMANDSERLHALMAAGYVESSYTYYDDEHILVFERDGESVFYPGYAILRAVRNGTEDALPARQRETLQAARKMVSGVSGTQRQVIIAIHDLLCRHITYTLDDSTDEDDRCIGAILNGEANCDGYADAFLLLCGLKDIPVRLVHGDSLKPADPTEDTAHMWNLVYLDGSWRGVDVTWDDDDENASIGYRNYNIGLDRMNENYRYLADFLPSGVLDQTDLLDRPVPEYRVTTEKEMILALKMAAVSERARGIFWLSEGLYGEYKSERAPIWKWLDLAGVGGEVTYKDEDRRLVVSGITILGPDCMAAEASTEREIIGLMRLASTAEKLSVYCSDALYRRYQDPDTPVWKWLDLAGISAQVSYNDDYRRLVFSQISANGRGVLAAEADTEAEIIALMRSAAGAEKLSVYCSESLYRRYKDAEKPVWKWLDLAGISAEVSYKDENRRLVFTNIAAADPGILVVEAATSAELVSLLRGADRWTVTEIRVYCSYSLFSEYANDHSAVWGWLKDGGISDASIRYNQDRRVLYIGSIAW